MNNGLVRPLVSKHPIGALPSILTVPTRADRARACTDRLVADRSLDPAHQADLQLSALPII